MAASRLDSDFQLFSPIQPSGDNDAQADSLLFPDATQDLDQDWTQWMRWDDATDPQSNARAVVNSTPGLGASNSISGSPTAVNGTTRKRKSTSDDDGSTVSGLQDGTKMPMPKQKRAHNVVEKRYRANLNEKISELRDSVPSLRPAGTTNGNGNGKEDAPKQLNKAVILSKATEYIRHLEIRNKRLEEENTGLKNRMRQVDKAADQSLTSTASVSSPSNCTVSTESGASSSPSIFSHGDDVSSDHSRGSLYPPEGLMKAPESFRKMWDSSRDKSYNASYIQARSQGREESSEGGRRRSRLPNKYMLGALAGLMVVEGVGREKSESKARELLAVPVDLFSKMQSPSMQYWFAVVRSHWHSWHVKASIHVLILAGLILGSAFLVFVYLFNSQPRRQQRSLKSDPDSTSPSSFRRQAWLTSIQQVGVPRHRFFLEWYAVTSRCFEYLLRCLMGWQLYSWVTGITEEDEKGRVKTWDIAIDAQLAGGDAEISRSRLVLTVFAAGTLPSIPVRMMQKSLHCRILLWRVGDPGSLSFQIFDNASRVIARYQWEQARKLQRTLPSGHPDALPSYLATLLAVESDDVMFDNIVQRAANLTWNRPTRDGTDGNDALLDIVEEDPAIQSSVDALAAWWSSHLLQDALLKYFETRHGSEVGETLSSFRKQLKLALDVGPQPSAAHTRALVMNAVFLEQNRVENIGKVLSALPREKGEDKQRQTSTFLDSSLPASARQEIGIAVRCAMIAAVFKARANGDSSLPASLTTPRAVTWFNDLAIDPVELTLLGFAAVYHLLHVVAADTDLATTSSSTSVSGDTPSAEASTDEATQVNNEKPARSNPNLGRVAAHLIYWARNAYNPAFYGLTDKVTETIEKRCTSICQDAGIDLSDYLEKESVVGEKDSRSPAEDFQSGEPVLPASDGDAQSLKVTECATSDGANGA